jgi:hypothetical protein
MKHIKKKPILDFEPTRLVSEEYCFHTLMSLATVSTCAVSTAMLCSRTAYLGKLRTFIRVLT